MEDVLLERFLKGDPLLIKQLRPIVLDFVSKTGGTPDDAKEVFQIISLKIFERSRRTPGQYVGRVFKTWLNKRRKDPPYVRARLLQVEAALDRAFAGQPGLLASLRAKEEAAVRQFRDIAGKTLLPFAEAEGADAAAADGMVDAALEKIQRVILDFKDYFLKSCKNEWFRLKKERGMLSSEEEITHLSVEQNDESKLHEQKNLILNLLQKASEACRKLLHQFYIEGKSKKELLHLLGYTPDSFDVAKSRCLSALRRGFK